MDKYVSEVKKIIIENFYEGNSYLEYSGVKTISTSWCIKASLGHHWSKAVRRLSIITDTLIGIDKV